MPRILVCRVCETMETLPLYDGPPELESKDPLLDAAVRRHVQKHGDVNPEAAALLVAPEGPCDCNEPKRTVDTAGRTMRGNRSKVRGNHTFWEGHQDEIMKGLKERWTGFNPEVYATYDTYREDALRCYSLHRRPTGGCIDWHVDNRRLTPEDWKGREVYLCDFCPVASTVVTEMRHKRGMYKKDSWETD